MKNYAEIIKKPEDVFKLDVKDITTDLFKYMLGNRKEGPRFKKEEVIIIKKGTYPTINTDKKTCIGNYLVNLALFEKNENLINIVGYINKRLSSKVVGDIESKLAEAVKTHKLSTKDLIVYLNNIQFFGFSISDVFCASLTPKTVFMSKAIIDKKKQLLKEYGDKIKDPIMALEMQQKLIDFAKKDIGEDDPGMDLYGSGSKASFQNNFSKLFLMNGPIMDLNTGKLRTSTTSYFEGVKREEMDLYANANTSSAFATAVNTRTGGYFVKKYIAALQSLVLDDKGSDCGTKTTIPILLTKENKNYFLDRNIQDKNKMVNLNKDNINSYVGRVIHLYDPMMCTGDKICNKCAGNLYYELGIKNIGLTLSKLCSAVMNKSLKKKHDATVKTYEIKDIESLYD